MKRIIACAAALALLGLPATAHVSQDPVPQSAAKSDRPYVRGTDPWPWQLHARYIFPGEGPQEGYDDFDTVENCRAELAKVLRRGRDFHHHKLLDAWCQSYPEGNCDPVTDDRCEGATDGF